MRPNIKNGLHPHPIMAKWLDSQEKGSSDFSNPCPPLHLSWGTMDSIPPKLTESLLTQGTTPTSQIDNLYDKNKNKKKRVMFSEQVSMRFTIARQDISQTEHSATWYSKLDFEDMTKACFKEIMKLERGKCLKKEKKYCARGIETSTRLASAAKAMNRCLACNVVLDEQSRQRREGIQEVDYLACIYHSATSSCQLWANVVGLSDQRAAEEMHDSDDDDDPERSPGGSQRQMMGKASNTSPASPVRIRNIEMARAA